MSSVVLVNVRRVSTWPSATITANGMSVAFLRTGGDKPPLVLLHGLMGSGAAWTPVARELQGELDVIMPDARGHGRSSAPESGYRYADLAADVIELIRELGLSRPVMVGHSMSGMTAAVVATRIGPLLRGLVLVDPTFLDGEQQVEVYASDVVDRHRQALRLSRSELLAEASARQRHRSPAVVELQVDARMHTSLAAFDILRPPNPPYRELVDDLDLPTLLVIGDRPVVSLETARQLSALNQRVRVVQIEGAGHGLPFDRPEQLALVVLDFVRALSR